jgi:hypothetical protein
LIYAGKIKINHSKKSVIDTVVCITKGQNLMVLVLDVEKPTSTAIEGLVPTVNLAAEAMAFHHTRTFRLTYVSIPN